MRDRLSKTTLLHQIDGACVRALVPHVCDEGLILLLRVLELERVVGSQDVIKGRGHERSVNGS